MSTAAFVAALIFCRVLVKTLLKSYKYLAFRLLFVSYSVNGLKEAQSLPALETISPAYRMFPHNGGGETALP